MTLVLVRKLLRDVRLPLLVVGLLLFGFSAFWVKVCQRVTTEIAPFFNGLRLALGVSKDDVDGVIFKGPGKVSQAIMGGADVQYDQPEQFLAVELLHPVVVILITLWAVGRAASAVAGELDRGTMELLLSQPIPRNRLILAHLLVDLVTIPALCLCLVAGTQVGLALVGDFKVDYKPLDELARKVPAAGLIPRTPGLVLDVPTARQPYAVANTAALAFALSGLTMAVSAVHRSRWRAAGWAGLIAVGMFVANVVGQLWDAAAFVRPFSLFFYYQPHLIWIDRQKDWWADAGTAVGAGPLEVPVIGVLVGVGAVGYLAALLAFTRRDLPAPL